MLQCHIPKITVKELSMINFNTMNDSNIRYILEHEEIENAIVNSALNVMVVFTEHWSPDWQDMDKDLMNNQRTEQVDINVYTATYNRGFLFDPFREFKENVWNSHFVPYIRFYKNGAILWETGHLAFRDVVTRFTFD